MRKQAAALLLAVISTGAGAFQNEPDGFRDFKWGDEPSAELTGKIPDRDMSFYKRQSDRMEIGGARLESILYAFYKDRLYAVVLTPATQSDGAALLLALEAQFGRATQPNRFLDDYRWLGPTTRIVMRCTVRMRNCGASLTSTRIEGEVQSDRKRAAEDAKKDF